MPTVSEELLPKPRRGCQFLRSKRISFSAEFENPKALIPVCYNGCDKVWTNWQTRTNLSWFTNNLLATSTARREESFYSCGNTEIRTIYIWKRADPNPYITYAVSFTGVAPEPLARLSIFSFKADIFLTTIRKPLSFDTGLLQRMSKSMSKLTNMRRFNLVR